MTADGIIKMWYSLHEHATGFTDYERLRSKPGDPLHCLVEDSGNPEEIEYDTLEEVIADRMGREFAKIINAKWLEEKREGKPPVLITSWPKIQKGDDMAHNDVGVHITEEMVNTIRKLNGWFDETKEDNMKGYTLYHWYEIEMKDDERPKLKAHGRVIAKGRAEAFAIVGREVDVTDEHIELIIDEEI